MLIYSQLENTNLSEATASLLSKYFQMWYTSPLMLNLMLDVMLSFPAVASGAESDEMWIRRFFVLTEGR